jgi:hypothetical protein
MYRLRQGMIDAMQLRGLSARTQEAYVAAVVRLARQYGRSPEQRDPLARRAGQAVRLTRGAIQLVVRRGQ